MLNLKPAMIVPVLFFAILLSACAAEKKETSSTTAAAGEPEAGIAARDDSGNFVLAGNLTRTEQERLKADLRYLNQTKTKSTFINIDKIFGFPEANSFTLSNWLADRVKYVVGNSMDFDNSISEVDGPIVYENPNTLPDVILELLPELKHRGFHKVINEEKGITVASNIGALAYLTGKVEKLPIGVNIPAVGVIAVKSTRIGLIKAGQGYSMTLGQFYSKDPVADFGSDPVTQIDSEGNRINRLGTLFHEARHSDGNGKHLGFMHDKCPKGHDLEGIPACDASVNGPYAIGSYSISALVKDCRGCTQIEREALRLEVIDSFNRLINKDENNANNYWDATPEGHKQ